MDSANVLALVGTPVVGDGIYKGECAAIAQFLVPGLGYSRVSQWKRAAKVKGNHSLRRGTVIAIFDSNGRYIGTSKHSHRNAAHTALYVRQSSAGIEIVHQFKSPSLEKIKGALVRWGGQSVLGHQAGVSVSGGTPEDDADNYHVVEL